MSSQKRDEALSKMTDALQEAENYLNRADQWLQVANVHREDAIQASTEDIHEQFHKEMSFRLRNRDRGD